MNASQFTPGPWRVGHSITGKPDCATLRRQNSDGEAFYDAMVESDTRTIAAVGGVGKAECLANARLISAAPELLEACKFALEWIQEMKQNNPQAVHSKGWGMLELESAIDKAEGNESFVLGTSRIRKAEGKTE